MEQFRLTLPTPSHAPHFHLKMRKFRKRNNCRREKSKNKVSSFSLSLPPSLPLNMEYKFGEKS